MAPATSTDRTLRKGWIVAASATEDVAFATLPDLVWRPHHLCTDRTVKLVKEQSAPISNLRVMPFHSIRRTDNRQGLLKRALQGKLNHLLLGAEEEITHRHPATTLFLHSL